MRMLILFLCALLLIPSLSIAGTGAGLGNACANLADPVNMVAHFISALSLATGAIMVFVGLIKFKRFRKNSIADPISTVVVLLAFGIILICLPYTHVLIPGGVPYITHA